ncbi:MAG: DNA-3-methyladenine glycosylase I [Actinomycetota bacterium]
MSELPAQPAGLALGPDGRARCWWAVTDSAYIGYHDGEWGFPVDDDRRLFEKICLEGFQSGLSWLTILRKRDNFRRAFAGFDPAAVAAFGPGDVHRLVNDAGIVRHRGKIEATINNAIRYAELVAEFGSLAAYAWGFEPTERPATLDHETLLTMATTPESAALSKDLRRRGWSYVGPTTVYAFMQAMGLVNDHVEGCVVRPLAERARSAFPRPRQRR